MTIFATSQSLPYNYEFDLDAYINISLLHPDLTRYLAQILTYLYYFSKG